MSDALILVAYLIGYALGNALFFGAIMAWEGVSTLVYRWRYRRYYRRFPCP